MIWPVLASAFVLGIASNIHCLGMCGPIAMAIPFKSDPKNWFRSRIIGVLFYNFGRVFSYSLLGVIAGILGVSIHFIGVLQFACIVVGIAIIVFAWRGFFPILGSSKLEKGIFQFISKQFGKLKKSNSNSNVFLFGMLNGILPCGMVYLALLNAVLASSIQWSAISMLVFGIGTFPAMIIVSFLGSNIQSFFAKYKFIVPVLVTFVGLLSILRGSDLGIPMLSPKKEIIVSKTQKHNSEAIKNNEAKPACCHK